MLEKMQLRSVGLVREHPPIAKNLLVGKGFDEIRHRGARVLDLLETVFEWVQDDGAVFKYFVFAMTPAYDADDAVVHCCI